MTLQSVPVMRCREGRLHPEAGVLQECNALLTLFAGSQIAVVHMLLTVSAISLGRCDGPYIFLPARDLQVQSSHSKSYSTLLTCKVGREQPASIHRALT
eukprot:483569-Pelagomonas_calceolata.AAC.1